MNMKKTALTAAIVAAIGATPFAAQAAAVDAATMSFTSGEFGMGFFTGGGFIPITDIGSGANQLIGVASGETWDTSSVQLSAAPGSIGSFIFGSTPSGANPYVNSFTGASDSQNVDAGGHALPSATWDDGTGVGTLDMGSFYANWNGTNFNQGTTAAMTVDVLSCDPGNLNCGFDASWTSTIVGGAFDGQTGSWNFSGTVSAVPVPAAAWLMGSGLVGLVGVARRRRRNVV